MQERRASRRFPIRCAIQCATGTQAFLAQAFDLSEDGISFLTSSTLPLNTEAVLRCPLSPDDPLMTVRVLVRQQIGERVGVQFLDLKHEDRVRVRRAASSS